MALDIPMSKGEFDGASETIDRLLEGQVAGLIGGDSAAFARRIPTDRALQSAIDRLERAGSRVRLLGLN